MKKKKGVIFAPAFAALNAASAGTPAKGLGGMAEWSNAAVLKTVEGHTSGGSNPSSSAKGNPDDNVRVFCFFGANETGFGLR